MNRFKTPLYILAVVLVIFTAWALRGMVQNQYLGGIQPWGYLGSLAIIMSIPVVVIFIIFQRTLLERMMFGNAE